MIIGLDVGGTHTDVVLLGENGLVRELKVSTDQSNLFKTVLTGLDSIMKDIEPVDIKRIVLSTTLTTNAIIQEKISKLGMIVASGPGIDPENFRTNELYFPISCSIDHRGREIKPIVESEIEQISKKFSQENITSVGIVGKFSTRNPDHENRIKDLLGDSFEKIFLGHQVSGNLNFPRRIATTYLNAAVYPIHKEFYNAVKNSLKEKGLDLPIHILKADGGSMNFESSIDYPGQTILSGPAASIMGSIAFAPEDEEVLSIDIGGTSTDMAILLNRSPLLDPLGIKVYNYKTLIRSLKSYSIGVGGDSVVRADKGKIKIGPERLGPAMAFGGAVPTPTDAMVVLGLLDDGDKKKSEQGIALLAKEIGLSVRVTADKIFTKACKIILQQADLMIKRINSKPVYTIHEIYDGHEINPKKILLLGGPAKYFAKKLEELSGYEVKAVPKSKVANAIGAALARTTSEVTYFVDTSQGIAVAPEDDYKREVTRNFSSDDAIKDAIEILEKKALAKGAHPEDLETEILENLEFNLVRGFSTEGKIIRIKVQVKPGLISKYQKITEKL